MQAPRHLAEGDLAAWRTNRLLQGLSSEARESLLRHATYMELPGRHKLLVSGQRPRYVYFLTRGLASHVVQFSKGGSVQVAMEGREGCVGAPHLIGATRLGPTCLMQVAGEGYRLGIEQVTAVFRASEEFRSRLLEFVQYHFFSVSRHSACNRLHLLEQRLAGWLLMGCDRTGDTRVELTQESLALMLGAQRTSMVVTINDFQNRNLTRNGRGWIEIVDQENLVKVACECYLEGKAAFENIYQAGTLHA